MNNEVREVVDQLTMKLGNAALEAESGSDEEKYFIDNLVKVTETSEKIFKFDCEFDDMVTKQGFTEQELELKSKELKIKEEELAERKKENVKDSMFKCSDILVKIGYVGAAIGFYKGAQMLMMELEEHPFAATNAVGKVFSKELVNPTSVFDKFSKFMFK